LKSENELPFKLTNGLVMDKYDYIYTWGNSAKTGIGVSRGLAYGGLSYYDGTKWVIYDEKDLYGISKKNEMPLVPNRLS